MTLPEIQKLRDRLYRKRKRWVLFLSLVMLACILICAWSTMHILPVYGRWYRANHFDEHPIGHLSGPFLLDISIRYDQEPPKDAHLVNAETGNHIYGLSEDPDRSRPGLLILTGDFDDTMQKGNYLLKLRPGDNRSLTCNVDILPSRKYMALTATPYRNSNNDLWLEIHAEFHNAAGTNGPNVSIALNDPEGKIDICSFKPDGPIISKQLNLSALFHDLDLPAGDLISISAWAEYAVPDGSGTAYSKKERVLELNAWPTHDPDGPYDYSMADTDTYLASLTG